MKEITVTEVDFSFDDMTIGFSDVLGFRSVASMGRVKTQLFLHGGKILTLHKDDRFSRQGGGETMAFDDFLSFIEAKAENLDIEISKWKKWRIYIPLIVFEFALVISAILRDRTLGYAVILLAVGAAFSLSFGYIWEKKARKLVWNKEAMKEKPFA
ncbi:MAG: hypothetical protein KAR06_10305 [Deltaproteobacteria bacterium]|nr:hypothetical protein [Deltaproteobacteria bacterium]